MAAALVAIPENMSSSREKPKLITTEQYRKAKRHSLRIGCFGGSSGKRTVCVLESIQRHHHRKADRLTCEPVDSAGYVASFTFMCLTGSYVSNLSPSY